MPTGNKCILFITRTFPPQTGGMERLSYNLILRLGHFFDRKVIINRWGKKAFPFFIVFASIRSIIYARKVDYVHLSDATLAIIGYLIKKLFNKPIIYNVHGLDLVYSSKIYQWYLNFFLKPDKLICNSYNTEKIAQRMGYQCTVVITPGIEVNKFNPSNTDQALDLLKEKNIFPNKDKILLTVGRLIKRKGVAWFCDYVMTSLPLDIKYIVVGDGRERTNIEKIIQRNDLQERIFLFGSLEQNLLDQIYQTADLFIMPNIRVKNDAEGFGFVAIEAAAWELPVVAANIEGIIDAVIHGKNGIMVESGNAAAFKSSIEKFIYNEDYKYKFGEYARDFTFRYFNWDQIIDLYKKEILSINLNGN